MALFPVVKPETIFVYIILAVFIINAVVSSLQAASFHGAPKALDMVCMDALAVAVLAC